MHYPHASSARGQGALYLLVYLLVRYGPEEYLSMENMRAFPKVYLHILRKSPSSSSIRKNISQLLDVPF